MDFLAIIREFGFLGAAVIVLCAVIRYLLSWVRELIEARQKDAERYGDLAVEREREMISAINDLSRAVEGWGKRGSSSDR